ncbi:MAG: sigma-70 family RNA polymerase sigma factor [Candidatus Limnocylindrales bacterium]|jgi:RNA polymerase sigma-70 factor (ECF subfamily)
MAIETVPTRLLSDDSLEQLMTERYLDLIRLAFLILHDQADAEDATQLALERAWRSRAELRSAGSTLFWLRRIVVREALRARSSPWRLLRLQSHVLDIEPAGELPSAPNQSERLDVVRAFRHLSADQSAVVVLHHYLAYPVSEVAEMLGVPLETVRSRLRLAMRQLREELRDA